MLPTAQYIPLPAGPLGLGVTLAQMAAVSRQGSYDPHVRTTVVSIVQGVDGRDGTTQARLIRNWLEDHTSFLRDPTTVEGVHTPRVMIDTIRSQGAAFVDCDDIAVLSAAMGMSIGLRARFVLLAFDAPNAPFRHVYTELLDPVHRVWIEQDITRPSQDFSMLNVSRVGYVNL